MADVFASTACLGEPAALVPRIRHLESHGFRQIELGSAQPCGQDELAFLARMGLSLLVHNYFPAPPEPFVLNLASGDPAVLAASRALCERAVELSRVFGAPFYSVHAGLRAEVPPSTLGQPLSYGTIAPYDEAYETFLASMRELCAFAAEHGVAIAVEPHVIAPFNLVNGRNELALMCESWELQALFRDVSARNLGVLVDVGHLNVTAHTLGFDRMKFVEEVGDRILGFHLHDNDGTADQHRPFDADAWFLPVLERYPAALRILECHAEDVARLQACAALAGGER